MSYDQTLIDSLTEKIRAQVLEELRQREQPGQTASWPANPNLPEFITIPEGNFLYGDNKVARHLPTYSISRTPVTVAQWRRFLEKSCYVWNDSYNQLTRTNQEDHPIVGVSIDDTTAYCLWLSETLGKLVRLPTEYEWEKAARGTDGRDYPWGAEAPTPDHAQINARGTASVFARPKGASPYGVLDMSGNVWEWTGSLWI